MDFRDNKNKISFNMLRVKSTTKICIDSLYKEANFFVPLLHA